MSQQRGRGRRCCAHPEPPPRPSPRLAALKGSLLWHRWPRTHSWNRPARRRLKGFPSSPLCPPPYPHNTALLFFLLAAKPKQHIHEVGSLSQMAGPAVEGWGLRGCLGPNRPGEPEGSSDQTRKGPCWGLPRDDTAGSLLGAAGSRRQRKLLACLSDPGQSLRRGLDRVARSGGGHHDPS